MILKNRLYRVRQVMLCLSFAVLLAGNVSATQVSDKSESVEVVEEKEDDLMNTELPSRFARAALTIPAEGVYDTIKDTNSAAGVMTERRFYKSGKLIEKRTYTSTGSTDCRMRNKYLYYSDGSTIERHRTYLNTGATCYNTSTKRYGVDNKIDWYLIYDGSKGYGKEGRFYDTTGTYYTLIEYYTAGQKTSKNYWLGATGNRVTHVANMNSAGTEWLKATYYYDYTNNKINRIINYTGKTPNLRTNETYYGTTGIKEWYKTYDSTGDQYHLTYYLANGIKRLEARYHKGTGVWAWDIDYQANGSDRKSLRYRNEDGEYTRQLYYYETANKVKFDAQYEDGIKVSAKVYDEETQKITAQEEYVDGVINNVIKFDLDGLMDEKYTYDENGIIESLSDYYETLILDEEEQMIQTFKSIVWYGNRLVDGKYNITLTEQFAQNGEKISSVFYDDDEGYKYKEIVYKKNEEIEVINFTENGDILPSQEEVPLIKIDLESESIIELKDRITSDNKVKISDEGEVYKTINKVDINTTEISSTETKYSLAIETEIILPNESSLARGVELWDKSGGVKAYTNVDIIQKTIKKDPVLKITRQTGNWTVDDSSIKLSNRTVMNGMCGTGYLDADKKGYYKSGYFKKHRIAYRKNNKNYSYNPKYKFYVDTIGPNTASGQSSVTLKRGKSKWTLHVTHQLLEGSLW